MREPVKVPAAVLEGIEACGASGMYSMFQRQQVVGLAASLGHQRAAVWIEHNPETYFRGVMDGFEADDTPEED
jgi:hypothetical protein